MLSAEHHALQHRLVQQLVSIREREMNYMLNRYQTIGTQAALIAGFCLSSITISLSPSDNEPVLLSIFFITTMTTVIACIHVILCTVFVGNWAPGLALRGPTGSMARAYDATRGERKQIYIFFFVALFCFTLQTLVDAPTRTHSSPVRCWWWVEGGGPLTAALPAQLAIWILDENIGVTPNGIVCSIETVISMIAIVW